MSIQLKSVYSKPDSKDGKRYLVETFWPQERQTPDLMPYEWPRILMPSFNLSERVRLDKWDTEQFRDAYIEELRDGRKRSALQSVRAEARAGTVTLLHSSRDEARGRGAIGK